MCGRFTLRTPLSVLAEQFQFDLGNAQLSFRYNIAPTQDVATVRLVDGKRQLAIPTPVTWPTCSLPSRPTG